MRLVLSRLSILCVFALVPLATITHADNLENLYRYDRQSLTLDDGGKIAYYIREGRGPCLVLIPGSWSGHDVFDAMVRSLDPDLRLVIVELRGCGESWPPTLDASIELFAEDVLRVIDALSLERFYIGGHSIGGMIPIEVAKRRPDSILGVISIEGWTHHQVQKEAFASAPKTSPEQVATFAAVRDRAKARMTKEQFDSFASAWKRWDGLPILENTSVPVLEIWGDRGLPAPSKAIMRIPERTNIALVWIPNAAHHLPTERPQDIAEAINRFVKKPSGPPADAEFRVSIRVDASRTVGLVEPIWRFFGYDEANYTYMPHGKNLLTKLGELGNPQVYVRCHHLLTSGDGTPALKWGSTGAYTVAADGTPVYNWTIVDRIFDTYLERGLKPYVEIGFMPEALSTHPEDYPQNPPPNELAPIDSGQAYPPKDYNEWAELVYQWAKHCVEKYGVGEVNQWYWGIWNEPNITYWRGSREEFFKLYDFSVDAVRRALPTARMGGPESAHGLDGDFLRDFLRHCSRGANHATGGQGAPLDFISFHAKGAPEFIDGQVRMGMGEQLRQVDDAFRVIASFEEFGKLPVIIGECDPEGCAACSEPRNAYRNGTMYSSYTAAVFPRILELAEKQNINLDGALTWAFEFEGQPPFAGFRALATDGIDLPVLNVFRMFAKMRGQRVSTQSSGSVSTQSIMEKGVRGVPDVSACASLDGDKLYVIVWNYHDDDVRGADALVELTISGLPHEKGEVKLTRYCIDKNHSNSYEAWKGMGKPIDLTSAQREILEVASKLAECEPQTAIPIKEGIALLAFPLQRQGVTFIVLDLTR